MHANMNMLPCERSCTPCDIHFKKEKRLANGFSTVVLNMRRSATSFPFRTTTEVCSCAKVVHPLKPMIVTLMIKRRLHLVFPCTGSSLQKWHVCIFTIFSHFELFTFPLCVRALHIIYFCSRKNFLIHLYFSK